MFSTCKKQLKKITSPSKKRNSYYVALWNYAWMGVWFGLKTSIHFQSPQALNLPQRARSLSLVAEIKIVDLWAFLRETLWQFIVFSWARVTSPTHTHWYSGGGLALPLSGILEPCRRRGSEIYPGIFCTNLIPWAMGILLILSARWTLSFCEM